MFGQITDREVTKELERRGLYTSAQVTPPITPIIPIIEPVIDVRKPIVTPPDYIRPITPDYIRPITRYAPPVMPIDKELLIPDLKYEEEIIFKREEPPPAPTDQVIVYPNGYREEEEPYVHKIPGITPPAVTVPVIPLPEREGFVLTTTHLIAGAVLLGIIFFFGGAPAAARAAARAPEPSTRARTRTVTEVY